jgi:hypothetical protein
MITDLVSTKHSAKLVAAAEELLKLKETKFKMQTLEWAIANSNLNSFEYVDKEEATSNGEEFTVRVKSTALVLKVFLAFRKGSGYCITDRAVLSKNTNFYYTYPGEVGEQLFRKALSSQIHELIGREPRIGIENSSYAIYYS